MTTVDRAGGYGGSIAVVTGGASGIGAATAELLTARGATVVTLDVNDPADGVSHEHVRVDLTDHPAVAEVIQSVARANGRLDLLVNNAGIGSIGTIEDGELAGWQRVFDVNVFGLANASRAALPALRRSAAGAIVNVCSLVAIVGVPKRAAYAASKGAVYALTLAMAADLLADRIRVNAVAPGTVGSPWVDRLLEAADDPVAERSRLEQRQPIGRLGTPYEIASVVAFLGSSEASFVNGSVWTADGGMAGLRVPSAARPAVDTP
jgi:NAD(P)-dependent dehydrogenase (short-subunit alcohol dehydrogenase family)